MVRYLTSVLVTLVLATTATVAAAGTPVFGKEKFSRDKGSPQRIVRTFAVSNPDSDFRIVVQNAEGKRGRVSSAIIELNGERIIGPTAFNKQTDVVAKPAQLQKMNEIAVEVRSEVGSSIFVTVLGPDTPAPAPLSGISVAPDAFPIDTPTWVVFNAEIPYPPSEPVPEVTIERISPAGDILGIEGAMVDNGDLSLGDEIHGDGVFSYRKVYSLSEPSKMQFRIKVDANGTVSLSDVFTLTVFTPIPDDDVATISEIQQAGEALYRELFPEKGHDQAAAEVVQFVKAYSLVKDAGLSEGGSSIWIDYTNGITGAILLSAPGTRGGVARSLTPATTMGAVTATATATSGNISVESKKVLILSPFYDEFQATDEGPILKGIYENHNKATPCPLYDVLYLQNSQVGLGSFKALEKYGIVHVVTHGGVVKSDVIIAAKTPYSAGNQATYQGDLKTGRVLPVTINGNDWLVATPKFFQYYIKSMPSSLVYFSACRTTANSSMANVLQGKGAKAFLGFSHDVPSQFAYDRATYFHEEWIDDPTSLVTTGEVFNGSCSGTACWNLLGANNLEAPIEGLENGGFESGSPIIAWDATGDGRVIPQLGEFSPVEGKYQGIVSTGLGFTTSAGSIKQKFCLPPNTNTLQFSWNFSSEEFVEWCGSLYQDTFTVDVITDSGTQRLFSRRVDDLCGSVVPTGLSFDQSGSGCEPDEENDCTVWSTGWQSQSIDISAIAAANPGKPITLRFSAGDVGDSIFDSAILLDEIQFAER